MDPSMKPPPSPLVVFGSDHIDTSRAEMLIQRLSDKIKEKRFKLQKMIGINEEKKKRNEMMKNEKLQLTTKLANIEQDNSVREQQLRSEQTRIKELQFNIQMLDEHNSLIKRDCVTEERKYEQEKLTLISKFERTKQQWTDIFKPQYEQSKVYQYLKQGDLAYNSLVERKETLLNTQKLAYNDYLTRRHEFCNEEKLQLSILSIATYFISRRDQLIKIEQMKEKLIELENKQKHLIDNKIDKMKAWESVYTQPVKRDLMDFCLQTNIDQVFTLSFNQMQQDIWSQPMTPITAPPILTPQCEQMELIPEEQSIVKPSVTFQSTTSIIQNESAHHVVTASSPPLTASSITIVPNMVKNVPIESNRSSILHLTTAIDDDDDQLFSTLRRELPTTQLEQMTINEFPPSTQAFVITTSATISDRDIDREVSSISQNDQSLTQAFAVSAAATPVESYPMRNLVTPTLNTKVPELEPIPSVDVSANKSHFQLAPPRTQNRPGTSVTSSIQPQVTSNDVQQMLLTFSPNPSSINEEQPQPMEADTEESQQQQQQQQRPTFSMSSSIESTASTQDGYTDFNYNFGFDGGAVTDNGAAGGGFTSPISFGNWANLSSPINGSSNDQFSAFLQQTNSGDNGVDSSFSFASFNYGDLGGGEASADGAFGSFFFGNDGSPNSKEQISDGR